MDAKAYYGEGAGTRRKLLKMELDKKLKDPEYRKAFEKAVKKVDTAKSAKKAVRDRKVADVKSQTKRSVKMMAKTLTGTTTLAAAAIFYMHNKPAIDAFIQKTMSSR